MAELPATARAPRFAGGWRIEWVERPVPRPSEGELLLAVRANALCGTDRAQYEQGSEVTPGHEAAGVVVAAGPGTHTSEGTPGVVYLMDFCGECRSCRLGATNQCLAKRADMGFDRDGGYGPYELVHESNFFPVPAELPLSEATLLLDALGTSGHALARARSVRSDIESLLVLGAGPVGLGVVAAAHLTLPAGVPILVSDVVPERLRLAERLGARTIDLRATELAQGVREAGLETVDLAVDGSGRRSAREAALGILGKRGVLVCVGHGEELLLGVSPDLIATERSVLGSEYFRHDELPANLELLLADRAYLGQLIGERYPVERIGEAFESFFGGAAGKVVVEQ